MFWNPHLRAGKVLIAGGFVVLTSCAFEPRPQAFHNYFIPPAHSTAVPPEPVIEPPSMPNEYYANEAPAIPPQLPKLPRPSDAEFLIKRADDKFAEGKRALQDGRPADARKDFDKAIEALLSAPENLADRAKVERRLEELVDSIYRYDVDQATAGESEDKITYDRPPLDGLLEMTFPVDPSIRSKVKEQILATTSQLPLQEDDSVIGAINFFTSARGKRIVSAGLKRSGKYKPMIEKILAEEGVPQELIYLAQEESGFMPRALSNRACVGLWQFAQFRGREYGLNQTPSTDERMDPEKATRAAARHLRDLYQHFGDWYLAMAAYDCGPACVDRAVMRTGYADFFQLRRMNALPKETQNYVPVILAMTIIGKNAAAYGVEFDYDRPMEFETLQVSTPTHLALIADAVDRPISELKELNPAVLKSVAPAGFSIHVPKGTLPAVQAAFNVIPAGKRDAWRLHRLESGDTFTALAKRYSASALNISSVNHDELPGMGELLAIPAPYPGEKAPRVTAAKTGKKSVSRKSPQVPVAASRKAAAPKKAAVAPKATTKAPVRRAAVARSHNG